MILIAAGSNLPFCQRDSQDIIALAFRALESIGYVRARSSFYKSPAWPDHSDPPFVNAVASVETALAPEALLAALHAVEAGFGRRRSVRNAPRTLDLDLLAYNEICREEDALTLPHRRIAERAFVLVPLCEIAPDWRHPGTGRMAKSLLADLDPSEIRRIGEK
ncbi:2-amino-4-hydroxy-6-hydroxymethyldihydropteridine diphosphokinase [Hyphococcus flavus]|uniref:2-amino-4-hydroxy-6-hydroxymethyldihydropteridine pyrophosphokinase n=1 Tax=Hyphococcus flavus TaxID=1866326 RepID=A0AAE9ZAX3_9PROT|nr:2-amino-4-hydroxy-6-hydroxymethyldihydropteridine diphosphokinase [Hyphococcus flavus]WDI30526.1 2-amino-4-hydroxy-6-hydroxymethyldihydropteridine diphosphokinase [Hyphococcus flavus]